MLFIDCRTSLGHCIRNHFIRNIQWQIFITPGLTLIIKWHSRNLSRHHKSKDQLHLWQPSLLLLHHQYSSMFVFAVHQLLQNSLTPCYSHFEHKEMWWQADKARWLGIPKQSPELKHSGNFKPISQLSRPMIITIGLVNKFFPMSANVNFGVK